MKKRILFRADGNSSVGLGHLYRLFALVEMVKDIYDFGFLTHFSSTTSVIPNTYAVIKIPKGITIEDEPKWLAENYNPEQYIIIADGYQFGSSYQQQLKAHGFSLVYIDDLEKEHMYADVVVNHSPLAKEKNYKSEKYTKFALGTDYAILRPSFLEAIKKNRVINKIDSVFICFGGADPYDLSLKAALACLNVKEIKKVNVVLGGAYKHDQVFKLAKENVKLNIYQNLNEKELISLMISCNLAIVPASTILYEICAVKMPVLSGYFVENQKRLYDALNKKKVIFGLDNLVKFKKDDFIREINHILNRSNFNEIINNQNTLFDSKIKERYLDLLKFVKYRNIKKSDIKLLYDWANDKLSRANSYNPNPISWEEHKEWFAKKIKDKDSIIYIAEINKTPAGYIRFDVKQKESVISILVSAQHRGKGLSGKFIKEASLKYFENCDLPIIAYIKSKNIASVKAFEKANYIKIKETIVNNSESYIYRLKKDE
ncbi:UDP-2,4-diacetamido-2,4,6-trideoxy-beta-L-altropyranose hydrolase [Abyssalbus ytuae]|uniref:UDP-2,4-diacetamido-2,4, 6-trideoxy-beta-L-altropyranose hydrolase n=1 Tax=Abyssalbus ytuae TaxID=2926907 RepID=A0A9E6ZS13_9FLAO|nr:UDP-2,4-diacetamido-2,4,6-trideoxy-beta-L-altropyranose hydrolase [Abyssalbus ytuae]UOB19415.1 UDP-2,4-diacetamido-2,4,6-trideoxy-beta-L-altropyranose hydrolase [Abyssalbus ytuae]